MWGLCVGRDGCSLFGSWSGLTLSHSSHAVVQLVMMDG